MCDRRMSHSLDRLEAQDTPYMKGFNAFLDGELACDYRLNSHYNREWHRGFNAAYFLNRGKHV